MKRQRLFTRWVRFNGIGVLGALLQLGLLFLLTRSGIHYLAATSVAVEATLLHNFCWHERWTWRERAAGSPRQALARLARFHASNGAISLAGNLLLMRLLTGAAGIDPVPANVAAILMCSLINFGASEWLVFRRTAGIAALLFVCVQPLHASAEDLGAIELRASTLQAWNSYVQIVESRFDGASATAAPLFALDAFGEGDWRGRARSGQVPMAKIERARPGGPEISVPDGKIHHWAGAVFIPGLSIDDLLERLAKLAGNEQRHYTDVIGSKLLSRDGDRYRIYMKLRRSKVITVTYNTEHDVSYRRLGAGRAAARSVSTKIAELDDAGTPSERERQPGSDSGYLWRLNAYWRYEAVPGGVLVECESVSLSRGVPMLLRVFVSGVVEGLARDSLERTLTGLRGYLTTRRSAR